MSYNTWLKAGEMLVIDGKTALVIERGRSGRKVEIISLDNQNAHSFKKQQINSTPQVLDAAGSVGESKP